MQLEENITAAGYISYFRIRAGAGPGGRGREGDGPCRPPAARRRCCGPLPLPPALAMQRGAYCTERHGVSKQNKLINTVLLHVSVQVEMT